jgi:hypothetical protein
MKWFSALPPGASAHDGSQHRATRAAPALRRRPVGGGRRRGRSANASDALRFWAALPVARTADEWASSKSTTVTSGDNRGCRATTPRSWTAVASSGRRRHQPQRFAVRRPAAHAVRGCGRVIVRTRLDPGIGAHRLRRTASRADAARTLSGRSCAGSRDTTVSVREGV